MSRYFQDTMISTTNFEKMKAFYRDFLKLTETESNDDYVLFTDMKTGQVLCLTNGPSITRPGPGLKVDDLALALKDMEKLGGKTIRTWEFGSMKGANAEDPEGNALMIWQGNHEGGGGQTYTETTQALCHQEARVRAETEKLMKMHQQRPARVVCNYSLSTPQGSVELKALFGDKKEMILVHNMGIRCSYCSLWADGLVGFTKHLESRAAFVVVSPDPVETQVQVKEQRGWNFRMVSSKGTTLFEDMGFKGEKDDMWWPGVSILTLEADGQITQKTSAGFGSGDLYCSLWNFMEMLPGGAGEWQPLKTQKIHP